ncbi:MAG: MarR family winged helix-turn-helix transcriptional regulator [Luteibaculaceae bacterium]
MSLEHEIKTTKFSSETQKAHLNIMFTNGWLRSKILKTLKPHNLTPEQYNVLRILKGQYPESVCLKDITERMIDRNSNTTRIVDKLALKGLVNKSQNEFDRREQNIVITDKGIALLLTLNSLIDESKLHKSPLSDKEAERLNYLLDKLRGRV